MDISVDEKPDPEWHEILEEISKQADQQGVKRLNVNMPISLHRRFKVKAAKEGQTMSDIVLYLIWQYVKEF